MPVLDIIHYPDPILLTVARPLADEEFDAALVQFVDNMYATMADAGGVGLAAPQVAVSKRLFVMDVPEKEGPNQRHTFINPKIITVEGEQIDEEGCLSFPGLFQVVQREMRVIVQAQDIKGDQFELDLTGLAARCVLHETDHCDGIVFLDRMTALKRGLAKRKIKRLQKTGEWI